MFGRKCGIGFQPAILQSQAGIPKRRDADRPRSGGVDRNQLMRVIGRQILVVLLTSLIRISPLYADPPMIGYMFPAGGQRGTEVTARIGGCNLYSLPRLHWTNDVVRGPAMLERTETIWFDGPVIPQPASQQREDYPQDYSATLGIPKDAPTGRQTWRLSTSQGVTAAGGFILGDFPEVVEVEQEGNTPAVAVNLPVTINGRIFPREDVDAWRFSATAGQVVTCCVATSAFGSPLDARLVICDSNGKVLAESIPAGDVTPPLKLNIPATGDYQVKIHDIAFQGLQNHVYRLTMTTGPVLETIYPLGGRRGTTTRFQLQGINLSESETMVALPNSGDSMLYRLPDTRSAFGNVHLQLDDFDEQLEPESPAAAGSMEPFNSPCILNGRIQSPGEDDVWRFMAMQGQEYDFDVHAARCGSPLDAVLTLCDATGKTIQEVDDSPGLQTDARLRWTANADGEYQIRIRDRLASRGDPRFAYRVRVTNSTVPEFSLKVVTDSLNIEQAQSANLKVTIERGAGFKEPVEVAFEGLPEDISMTAPIVIAANQQEVQIPLKVAKPAKIATYPVRIAGTATVAGNQIRRLAAVMPAAPPQGQDPISIVDADSPVWISTTIPTPFKFVGIFETKFIPRGGVYIRKYRIERNGFEGPLEVQLADRQGRHLQGVTARPVTVESNQNEFDIVVQLPPWMEVGRTCRSTLAICGVTTDAQGQSHTISYSSNDQNNQMIALVATGRLTIQLPHATMKANPNQRIELPIRIQRSPGIVNSVKLELVESKSVRGVRVEPITIEPNKDSGTLILELGKELHGLNVQPLKIRAATQDERQLPVTAEASITLVDQQPQSP